MSLTLQFEGVDMSMNKRQIKKRNKTINARISFFNSHIIYSGRRNGKTFLYKKIVKACYSKKYKPFREFKKVYEKIFLSIDFSNGKDYSVCTKFKINKGITRVIKTEILDKQH